MVHRRLLREPPLYKGATNGTNNNLGKSSCGVEMLAHNFEIQVLRSVASLVCLVGLRDSDITLQISRNNHSGHAVIIDAKLKSL